MLDNWFSWYMQHAELYKVMLTARRILHYVQDDAAQGLCYPQHNAPLLQAATKDAILAYRPHWAFGLKYARKNLPSGLKKHKPTNTARQKRCKK